MSRTGHRLVRAAVACGVGLLSVAGVTVPASIASASPASPAHPAAPSKGVTISSTGLKSGAIKHVWLIILENKSYDATFTGLNQNSYLWKTLPQQGVLLKNYYGTGHFSMDNYVSMVSGQSPNQDTQEDCSVANRTIGPNSDILHSTSSLHSLLNYGQMNSPANATQPSGANAPNGQNGCTYPTDVPTLFNQLNANAKTWKGYAQDIGGAQTPGSTSYQANTVPNREAAACAGPGTPANNPDTNPTQMSTNLPAGVTSLTGAQPNDQYVAKHFPFPWFQSLTGSSVNGPGAESAVQRRHQLRRQPRHEPGQPADRPGPRPEGRQGHSGIQLGHPGQLQRRPRRGVQGQQPVRRVHRERRAELQLADAVRPGVDHAEELHRRPVRLGPVPQVLHPADRAVAGVQAGRP